MSTRTCQSYWKHGTFQDLGAGASYFLHFVLHVHDNKWKCLKSSTEVDTIGEQQAEADAIKEQQLKRIQSGSSS